MPDNATILKGVVEYSRVIQRTEQPDLMSKAYYTPLIDPKEVHFLVARMCIRLNIPLPKIFILNNTYRSWARINSYQLGIGMKDINVEIVLHELAHLLSTKPEQLGTKRKTYHGRKFTKTLDKLLVIWGSLR